MADELKKLAGSASWVNPVIGAASSVFSTVLGNIFSKNRQEMAHKYAMMQSEHNAKLQYDLWKTQLREGSAREVAGMKAAGLNPAMMQGSGSGAPPLSSSPGSPVSANPVSTDLSGIMEGIRLNNETKLADAQARNLNAEAASKENSNSKFLETWETTMNELKARADEQFSRSDLNRKSLDEVSSKIDVLNQTVQNLQQELAESKQRVTESEARTDFTKKQANSWNDFIWSQIRRNMAQANLFNGQNAREGQMLLFNMSNSAALSDYYDNQSLSTRLMNQWNTFLMNQDMKFKEWQNWIGLGTSVLNCVGDNFYKVASGLGSFVPFTSHSYSSGYTPFGGFVNESFNYRAPTFMTKP